MQSFSQDMLDWFYTRVMSLIQQTIMKYLQQMVIIQHQNPNEKVYQGLITSVMDSSHMTWTRAGLESQVC